jgi:hypothetical protein
MCPLSSTKITHCEQFLQLYYVHIEEKNCENRRQTKHEKSKQKIVFFTILDILTEFKIPYQAICQTEGIHFQF